MTKTQASGSKHSIIEYAIKLEDQLETMRTDLETAHAANLYAAYEARDVAHLEHFLYVEQLKTALFRGATLADLREIVTGEISL